MAISAGFKQACPSCEALVPVRDPSLIGKKIDCPKCKYRFVVEDPVEKDKAAVKGKKGAEDKSRKTASGAGKNGANGRTATAVKKPQTKRLRDEDDDDDDQEAEKKKAGSNKMTIGIALAALGLVLLGVAAFFLLRTRDDSKKGDPPPVAGGPGQVNPGEQPPVGPNQGGVQPGQVNPPPIVVGPVGGGGAELTNMLPNDTEHVLHGFLKEIFDPLNPLRAAAFKSRGAFLDDEIKKQIGFSLLALDDLIHAERFTPPAWSFNLLHSKDTFELAALTEALGLKEVENPPKDQKYYLITRSNPWFEGLSRLSIGVPANLRQVSRPANQPMYVRLHDSQTLIVSDEGPMVEFLKVGGQFKVQYEKPPPATVPNPFDPNQPFPMPPGGGKGIPGRLKPGGAFNTPADSGIRFTAQFQPPAGQQPPPGEAPPMFPPGSPYGKGPPDPRGQMPPGTFPGQGPAFPGQGPGAPGAEMPPTPAPSFGPGGGNYLTIKPKMKELLDRMEFRDPDSKEKVLVSMATEMDAALRSGNNPERALYHFRHLWDLTHLLVEKAPLNLLGAALIQKDLRRFQYRSEVSLSNEKEAKKFVKALEKDSAPALINFFDQVFSHKVELVKPESEAQDPTTNPFAPPGSSPFPMPGRPGSGSRPPLGAGGDAGVGDGPPQPGGFPGEGPFPGFPMPGQKKTDEAKASRLVIGQKEGTVDFTLDLVLDQVAYARLYGAAELMMVGLRSEIELMATGARRHALALAGKLSGERGMPDRGTQPGNFLPGAFPRQGSGLPRSAREPNHRVSWMAGLLPFLGHDGLYQKIRFDASWKDTNNWLAGRNIVPEFLDPMYPDSARYVYHPLYGDYAATHFVGIAGVGLDAADYPRGDPAFIAKRGVFGYDKSASLEEVRSGRGLSNTILMIQVPHDGPAGVSPWIAGGGATVRGVPEKNSIGPFVLTTDRNGKPIQQGGKSGTYALMSDGSVRFIDKNISDEVFKAMCTLKGPAPADFEDQRDEKAPLVKPKTDVKQPAKAQVKELIPTPAPKSPETIPQERKPLSGVQASKDGRIVFRLSDTEVTLGGLRVAMYQTKKAELEKILGPADRSEELVEGSPSHIAVWDKKGFMAHYFLKTDVVFHLTCYIGGDLKYEFQPESHFNGVLQVQGLDVTKGTTKQELQARIKQRLEDEPGLGPNPSNSFRVDFSHNRVTFVKNRDQKSLEYVRLSRK
jgi:hypothetical protein